MFENIILVVEKELRETYNFHGGFNYLGCDPEGAKLVSKAYKEYETLLNELKQLKAYSCCSSEPAEHRIAFSSLIPGSF